MSEAWLNEPLVSLLSMFMLAFAAGSVLPVGSEWFFVWRLSESDPPVPLWLTAATGNFLGGWLTWWLGKAGREKYLSRRRLPLGWQRAESLFRRYGVWSLLLSWVPLLGDILVVMAGMARTPVRLTLLLLFTGKALRYALLAGVVGGLL